MNYETLSPKEIAAKTAAALEAKGYEVFVVEKGADALAKIKDLITPGVSVMNGASKTLEQIGYIEYLKSGQHPWVNLYEKILAEKDPAKQSALRKQATLSDYYFGSVHALTETGEFVIGSNTASQLPHVVFTSPNLIFVVSTKKIVPTLADAFERLEAHVVPQEDRNMKEKYGIGTNLNKIVVFRGENSRLGRKIRIILVNENLGF